jgi:integrase/recombinase XerD
LTEAKNLATATGIKTVAGESPTAEQEINGKILELLFQLEGDGKKQGTIESYSKLFRAALKHGANLRDPEDVKDFLAKINWKDNTKKNAVAMLNTWFEFIETNWKPPKYYGETEDPFIPTEQEIDLLIAASGKIMATYLQLLKETGARCGEISGLKWTDIDFQQRTVRIKAEKGSRSRTSPLSPRALEMVGNIPKQRERPFVNADDMRSSYYIQRKRIARKLSNPRILQIHFHTLRHWKGTTEYLKTTDMDYAKEILGHRSILSTQVYVNIGKAIRRNAALDDFHVKVATTKEEITQLLESGFEYVFQKEDLAYFRKRK